MLFYNWLIDIYIGGFLWLLAYQVVVSLEWLINSERLHYHRMMSSKVAPLLYQRMLGVSRASRRATRFRTTRSRRGIIQMRGSLLWRKFGTFIDSSVEDSFCDEERDLR
ncbi:uncharacterized protein DS421_10g309410 [Arachis hypogaea]|nr:uncharacterized protein DS421_10g309410 [Arachis hypogaea]